MVYASTHYLYRGKSGFVAGGQGITGRQVEAGTKDWSGQCLLYMSSAVHAVSKRINSRDSMHFGNEHKAYALANASSVTNMSTRGSDIE